MLKEKKTAAVYAAYILIFFAVWAALTVIVFPSIENKVGLPGSDMIKDGLFKTVIWTIPALFLMKGYREKLSVKEGLFRPGKSWWVLIPGLVGFTIYLLMVKYRTSYTIALAEDFSLWLIPIYLFVGFNEEIVFRGWLLNSTVTEKNKVPAIAANAVLFLLIHFPTWIMSGTLAEHITSGSFIIIAMLSVVFSLCFTYSKSVTVPALMHFWWDFLIVALK